jgi:hypothetical protein
LPVLATEDAPVLAAELAAAEATDEVL